jgi:hypothetical protein
MDLQIMTKKGDGISSPGEMSRPKSNYNKILKIIQMSNQIN